MPFTPSFSHTLGPSELEVMRVRWRHQRPMSGEELREAMNARRPADKQLAPTTLYTLSQRLTEKGMLTALHNRKPGHSACYIAAMDRAAFLAHMLQQIAGELGVTDAECNWAYGLLMETQRG